MSHLFYVKENNVTMLNNLHECVVDCKEKMSIKDEQIDEEEDM